MKIILICFLSALAVTSCRDLKRENAHKTIVKKDEKRPRRDNYTYETILEDEILKQGESIPLDDVKAGDTILIEARGEILTPIFEVKYTLHDRLYSNGFADYCAGTPNPKSCPDDWQETDYSNCLLTMRYFLWIETTEVIFSKVPKEIDIRLRAEDNLYLLNIATHGDNEIAGTVQIPSDVEGPFEIVTVFQSTSVGKIGLLDFSRDDYGKCPSSVTELEGVLGSSGENEMPFLVEMLAGGPSKKTTSVEYNINVKIRLEVNRDV